MSAKPKIAFYWCASCGGCEETVVDFAEELLPILDAIEIVFWPVAMDFKKRDLEDLADGAITATFLNGAIRTSEQEEMARLLRAKSRYLIAYGACAQLGGIPGLANQFTREDILRYVYEQAPTVENPAKIRPDSAPADDGNAPTLPAFQNRVRALHQVVPVDYYIPGCPPTPQLTRAAIARLLGTHSAGAGANATAAVEPPQLPPRGSVLAPDTALCDECPRRATKPEALSFSAFHRPHEVMIDRDACLLAQGVVCMGPATRGGCGAVCLAANMPCTGCSGPTSRVRDQGAKMISSLSANLTAREPAELSAVLDAIPDPVGTFYRYALPTSLLQQRRNAPGAEPLGRRAPVLQAPGPAPEPASASQTPSNQPTGPAPAEPRRASAMPHPASS